MTDNIVLCLVVCSRRLQVDTALAVWKNNLGLTWKVENYEAKCNWAKLS